MRFNITPAKSDDYFKLADVWEKSVRFSHTFLSEDNIRFFRKLLVEEYFGAVKLRIAKTPDNNIIGFVGVDKGSLEMLFLDPNYIRQGYGSRILQYSITDMGVYKVDVNEQNIDAVKFYISQGFCIKDRSEKDHFNNPYPILHMSLMNLN